MTIQQESTDINLDSKALAHLLGAIASTRDLNANINGALSTSAKDLNMMFRKSNLIRKIVSLLPVEGANAGYIVKKNNGEVISDSDIFVMRAFSKASIFARLYGKAYLILETGNDDLKPLEVNAILTGYKVKDKLKKKGDFYFDSREEKIAHHSKVYLFFGNLTYDINNNVDDEQYSDSILLGLIEAFRDFESSTAYGKKILKNLSNLTIGMKGLGMKLRTTAGKAEIADRLMSFDTNRSIDESIAYDIEHEKVDYISQTLTGIPDVLDKLINIFVANTEYDSDKLFPKTTSTGISSGIQNQLVTRFEWATQVKKWSEDNYVQNLIMLYNYLTGDKNQIQIIVPLPLALTDLEKIEIEDRAADRNKKLIDSQIITAKEARRGYSRSTFDIEIVLDDEEMIHHIATDPQPTEDSKETLSNTDIDSGSDALWLALSKITLDDIDIVAEEAIST